MLQELSADQLASREALGAVTTLPLLVNAMVRHHDMPKTVAATASTLRRMMQQVEAAGDEDALTAARQCVLEYGGPDAMVAILSDDSVTSTPLVATTLLEIMYVPRWGLLNCCCWLRAPLCARVLWYCATPSPWLVCLLRRVSCALCRCAGMTCAI